MFKKIMILILGMLSMPSAVQGQQGMEVDSKIYVAGHRGLVGSALLRRLKKEGFENIITRTHQELDLRDFRAVEAFFAAEKPEYVFLSAAKVGGIHANNIYPAEFFYDNIMIATNIIHCAHLHGVKKLLFLGSSCIYPRDCKQPIKEEYLMTGPLEKTNDAYAVAKIAGIQMCASYKRQYGSRFIACMPTNLFGINDNFNLETSHVLPALIRKVYEAKRDNKPTITVWGSGRPLREFLYVDDLADACLFLMQNYEGDEALNIGTGSDITILDLVHLIKDIVGYTGEIIFDASKPDGTPRKQLCVDRLTALGWQAQTSLRHGIEQTIAWCEQEKIF